MVRIYVGVAVLLYAHHIIRYIYHLSCNESLLTTRLLCSLANDQLKHLQYNTWREEEQYFFFKLNEILGAETGIVLFHLQASIYLI